MHDDAPDLELSLPARADNVAVVRHVLGGVGDVMGFDTEALDDVRLAVSEACANVVLHAYPDGPGLLVIQVFTSDQVVAVVVRDSGTGIAPRTDSPGLGVGLPLIAALARTLELSAPPGGGTELRMSFDVTRRSFVADGDSAGEAGLGTT